jgi:hypothetical protein
MQNAQKWVEARVHALRDVTPTVREITLKPTNGALPHCRQAFGRWPRRLQSHVEVSCG